MPSQSELLVHTVKSMRIAPSITTVKPFKRIIGIEADDGFAFWERPEGTTLRPSYNIGDADESLLKVDNIFSDRLKQFCERYLSSDVLWGRTFYNCHVFGFSMESVSHGSRDGCEEAAGIVAKGQIVGSRLALGQHGVVGGREGHSFSTLHSAVGLGDEHEECIEVLGAGENMALEPIDDMLNRYEQAMDKLSRRIEDFGLYALKAVGNFE